MLPLCWLLKEERIGGKRWCRWRMRRRARRRRRTRRTRKRRKSKEESWNIITNAIWTSKEESPAGQGATPQHMEYYEVPSPLSPEVISLDDGGAFGIPALSSVILGCRSVDSYSKLGKISEGKFIPTLSPFIPTSPPPHRPPHLPTSPPTSPPPHRPPHLPISIWSGFQECMGLFSRLWTRRLEILLHWRRSRWKEN